MRLEDQRLERCRWVRRDSHTWSLTCEGFRCNAVFAQGPAGDDLDERPVRLEVFRDDRTLQNTACYAEAASWRVEGRSLLARVIKRETRRLRRRGTAA